MQDELDRRKLERPLDFVVLHPKQQEAEHQQEELKKRIIALFWGNRCFAKGTLIATPYGDIPIEQLHVGQHVLTIHDGELITEKISKTYKTGVDVCPKPMIQFSHGNKTTRCTYDHPYRVGNDYVPIYQLIWGKMEERERLQLKLLCKQYGQDFDDNSLWPQEDRCHEASSRQAWVLPDHDEWSHCKSSSCSCSNMDTKSTKQTNGESHRQQPTEQQGGEFGMGNIQGTISTPNKARSFFKKLGRIIGSFKAKACRHNFYFQATRKEKECKNTHTCTGTTQDISTSENGFNKRCFKRAVLEVSAITISRAEEVYDIEVEHTHNFFANGVCVHNCGKTEFAAIRVAKIMTGRSKLKTPPVHGWAFCPSYEAQADTTQKKLLQYLGDAEIDWDKTTYIRKGILKCLVLNNGSTLTFKSYEQGREKVQGAGLDFVWFDEEPPHDIYEEACMRVEAGKRLLIIMTMTPIKGITWVYKTIYLNTSDPSLFVSTAGWDDNPYLTTEQKDLMGRGLSDVMIQVRRYGKFTRRVGLVCNWFDRMVHVIPYSKVPKTGTILRGIDFGWTAPTCILWVLLDASHNVYIFDGIYKPGLTTPELVKIINMKEAGMGIVIGVGDSAQASDIAEMRKAGINIIGIEKQSKTKAENWDEYRARLMAQYGQVNEFTNKPKLFIADTVLEQDNNGELYNFVVNEMERLLWTTKLNKETGEQDTSRTWGDQAKHSVDALTYILAHMERPQDNVRTTKSPEPKYKPLTEFEGYEQDDINNNFKTTDFMS